MTLGKFVEQSNISADLIRAVVRQFGGWSDFKEAARDVCRGGIDGGFHGFIYYTDTVKFAKRNRAAIVAMADDMARELGEGGALELIRGFNCFRNDKPSTDAIARAIYQGKGEDAEQILNALAWFAGEEVCRAYDDLIER